VNYVEHHFGDYARDTAHLSIIEHGAYRLLLDLYYVREKLLPADMKECCRLVRAVSAAERKAVASVLAEFFERGPDGWLHRRCESEIARFRDKQEKAKRSASARWNAPKSQSERNANAYPNAYPNAMRTQSERNAVAMLPSTKHQAPDTKHQAPAKALAQAFPEPGGDGGSGALSRALRAKGIESNPMEPRLLALAAGGITPALAEAAADEARRVKGPGARIPPAYVYAVLDRWLAEPESRPQSAYDPDAVAAEAIRMMEERDAQARTA